MFFDVYFLLNSICLQFLFFQSSESSLFTDLWGFMSSNSGADTGFWKGGGVSLGVPKKGGGGVPDP